MKKIFGSVAIALALILSLQSMAFASGRDPIKSGTKSTPYGDMEGNIYVIYRGVDGIWMYASTEIDSKYTMAEITCKLDVCANDTGELYDQGSETLEDANYVECFADGDPSLGTMALFSTHEVTYTRSYVLYLSTTA